MDLRQRVNPMAVGSTPRRDPETARRRGTTTLYALLTALQEQLGPDNDALVVAIVCALCRSRRHTWAETPRTSACPA